MLLNFYIKCLDVSGPDRQRGNMPGELIFIEILIIDCENESERKRLA